MSDKQSIEKPDRRGDRPRRRSARYRSGVSVALQWGEGDASRSVDAVIMDHSRDGAALLVDEAPPPTGPARLRITEGNGTDWVEVVVISARSRFFRPTIVRVTLADGPSYAFFRAAMPGAGLDGAGPDELAEEFDPRDWR